MLEFTFHNFDEVRQAFDPRVVQKAVNRTVVRVGNSARAETGRRIRDVYAIKARDINRHVKTFTERTGDSTFRILRYSGAALPIDRFSTSTRTVASDKGRRVAVSARVLKGAPRKIVRGAFPLRGRAGGGPTMKREGDERLPIGRVYRLSVPQMINRRVRTEVEDFIERRANIELDRNLRFYQERASKQAGLR